jgi:hypothetical protein
VDGERQPRSEPTAAGATREAPVREQRPEVGPAVAHDALEIVAPDTPTAIRYSAPNPIRTFTAFTDDFTQLTPGTMGVVGRDEVFTTLNSQIGVHQKEGYSLRTTRLNTFWTSTAAYSPQVVLDIETNRFVFAALDFARSDKSELMFAMSRSAGAAAEWSTFRVPIDLGKRGVWGDSPRIGYNSRHIVVTVNCYEIANPSFFVGTQVFVIDKASVMQQNRFEAVYYFVENAFGLAPAAALSPSGKVYLVETLLGVDGLRIRAVDEVAMDDVAFVFGKRWAPSGVNGRQPSGQPIDLGDDRIVNAVYRNGTIHAAHTAFLPRNAPTRAAAQYWQIHLTAPGSATQYVIEDPAGVKSYAAPSVAVNGKDDVMVGFTSFSPNQNPTAAFSLRVGSESAGRMSKPYEYRVGAGPWWQGVWSDTSATVIDPSNDGDFWTLQQHTQSVSGGWDRWGTSWALVRMPLGTPPAIDVVITGTKARISYVSTSNNLDIEKTTDGVNWTRVNWTKENFNIPTAPLIESNVEANRVFVYRAKSVVYSGNMVTSTGWGNYEPASSWAFTDDPLRPGSLIRRTHLTELRTAMNQLRVASGLPAMTHEPLPLLAAMRAQHLRELRTAIASSRSFLDMQAPAFTDPALTERTSGIRAVHLQELRDALR